MADSAPLRVARGLSILLLALALLFGITRRGFDYDEIEHAHATWLVAAGETPFHDFFECHPPLLWYAWTPIARLIPDLLTLLLVLRWIAAAGNVAVLALLAANIHVRRGANASQWTALALAFIACTPAILQYLIELRIDSWPLAALLAAAILLERDWSQPAFLQIASFCAIAVLASLASPKIAPLALLLCAAEVIRRRRSIVTTIAAMAAGAGAAALLALLFFSVTAIEPQLAYELTIAFHVRFAEHASFPAGLGAAILQQPLLATVSAAGVICWIVDGWRKARAFEIAVLAYLVLQLFTVPFPYKQYTAPFFLFAAIFIPSLFDRAGRYARSLQWLLVALIAVQATSSAVFFARETGVEQQGAYLRFVDHLALPPGARVVAPVPLHPVTRKDAMYGWLRSFDPGGSYETEQVMTDLRVPGISDRFLVPAYLRELETNRPHLIVIGAAGDQQLAPRQMLAVATYLQRHRSMYRAFDAGGMRVWIRAAAP